MFFSAFCFISPCFVPFAFCLERLLFSYSNIYKRIIAFASILVLLIAVIYKVHPAFQLAYSPMVVILAFFIMGLSLMVTLIIFFRFEDEMILLQSRAQHVADRGNQPMESLCGLLFPGRQQPEAPPAANRADLRDPDYPDLYHHELYLGQDHAAPWRGFSIRPARPTRDFLLKNANWQDLPPEALAILTNTFRETGQAAPRVWLEAEDRTRSAHIPVRYGERGSEAQGHVGLIARGGRRVTGIDRILVGGRWLRATSAHGGADSRSHGCAQLGIDPQQLHDVRGSRSGGFRTRWSGSFPDNSAGCHGRSGR